MEDQNKAMGDNQSILREDQFNVLSNMIKNLQSSVDDTNKNMSHDRSDIDKLLIRSGAHEETLERVNKRFEELEEKVKSWVKDAVHEQIQTSVPTIVEAVLKEYVEGKQPKTKPPSPKKRWQFWKH